MTLGVCRDLSVPDEGRSPQNVRDSEKPNTLCSRGGVPLPDRDTKDERRRWNCSMN